MAHTYTGILYSSGSHKPFTLLKLTEDTKECLFLQVTYNNFFVLKINAEKFQNIYILILTINLLC